MTKIGKLETVPLRELWKHEERGFSAWLEANLASLSDALGIVLLEPQRETKAGNFEVDLVAEDINGNRVIVENQLETTDHDHLGKVLTYLTNLDAKTAIWICRKPRAEHIRAIQWLNETTPEDITFYLVQVAAYRIGGSEAAPLFTVIVGPSAESKGFGRQKKELAERHVIRLKFWEELLRRAKEKALNLHAARSPTKDSWISAGAGLKSGLAFSYVVWLAKRTAVEFWIGTDDKAENKRIFDLLHERCQSIEKEFGAQLIWERLDEGLGSRIRWVIEKGGIADSEQKWPEIQDAMIDAMKRLSTAIKNNFSKI